MNFFILSLILIHTLTSQKANAIVDGLEAQPLSTFGRSAVLIVKLNKQGLPEICSGSFVSHNHILTAAHCVSQETQDTTIKLGVKPLDSIEEQQLSIEKITVHPDYNKSDSERNDLAIIKFKETLKDTRFIYSLPENQDHLLTYNLFDQTATAVGYGQIQGIEEAENQDDDIGILRYVKLKINLNLDKNIIAQQSTGGGVCFGDSGGGLLVRVRKIKYLIGVSSGVFNDDSQMATTSNTSIDYCRKKSIFMNTLYYLDWIKKNIAD